MGNKSFFDLKNQQGQSTVEYLLLLLVVAVLSFSIYNSARFKNFLGPDSQFFSIVKSKIEFSYRHGHDSQDDTGDLSNHKTFKTDAGESRFFSTFTEAYGQ
ncbi:MAG: hypothetical protein Fur0010_14170 [Bdellovibrio sp.]